MNKILTSMGDLAEEDPEVLCFFLQMFKAKEDLKSIPCLFSLIYHYCLDISYFLSVVSA